jgi:Fe-S-cluster containining protein
MSAIRLDTEQRFTCSTCARCCHTEVVVTPGERAAYDGAQAGRWFREADGAADGAARAAFEPLSGRPGWSRIRRRADGTCGFLSPQNLCRIHQELGADRKPLVCRLYPFGVFRTEIEVVAKTAFSCPTIAANEGEPVATQAPAVRRLLQDWERDFGREARPLELVRGRPLAARALTTIRDTLRAMLDTPDADLSRSVRRMGFWLHDLARPRVARLAPDDFAEYVAVTGRHAREADRLTAETRPTSLSRLFARGFLFIVATTEAQRSHPQGGGLNIGLRWRLARLLAHAHGLGPATAELQMSARGLPLDVAATSPLLRHYLRASIETLGAGRRPVLDELALAAAVLRAAIDLGAMNARRLGAARIGREALRDGLAVAANVTHVDGTVASILDGLTGGADAFYRLADGL